MANAGATVTVEWGYETHSITLTPKNWARVKYAPPDEPFGSRVETLAVGCCVHDAHEVDEHAQHDQTLLAMRDGVSHDLTLLELCGILGDEAIRRRGLPALG
jgi:hypothetical protein